MSTWFEIFTTGKLDTSLFSVGFLERWGNKEWSPTTEDQDAASRLYGELISRVATNRLGYLSGDVGAALESIYQLFPRTREIADKTPKAHHFQAIAWEVLNSKVRPFTAKWHPIDKAGGLDALDTTDDFRSELEDLRLPLAEFTRVLAFLRDGVWPVTVGEVGTGIEDSIVVEISKPLDSRIHTRGDLDASQVNAINVAESKAIAARRTWYGLPASKGSIGLALSGGGIRSATFSLGVLAAMAKRDLLKHFDYLSTVSGGGYIGSFLSCYLAADLSQCPLTGVPDVGLRCDELPFLKKEGEAEALRHIRHHSKYLAVGSFGQRLQMGAAQVYGMILNSLSAAFIVSLWILGELYLRQASWTNGWWSIEVHVAGAALIIVALLAPITLRMTPRLQGVTDAALAYIALVLLVLFSWQGLSHLHRLVAEHLLLVIPGWWQRNWKTWLTILGAIPLISSALTALFGTLLRKAASLLIAIATVAGPLFIFCLYLVIYQRAAATSSACVVFGHGLSAYELLAALSAILGIGAFIQNINFTSPHRHYRNKLAQAYLVQPKLNSEGTSYSSVPAVVKISDLNEQKDARGPYHLINAALNVPASKNPKMQGRRTDFFLFSPAYCGSPLTGYRRTCEWESWDKHLDLGTAMAISGAAASPQMGIETKAGLRFWMVILNIRVGYWLRKPAAAPRRAMVSWLSRFRTPGLSYLFKEMVGRIDENSPWLNLSDGGHIENLGVYELLRRRCKFIVAVDGEQDPRMTFAALTTLQRLAAIDLNTQIEVNLDDLRRNESGLSRSHFRFCRVTYPNDEVGYLLYVKLSLTGNEGEFIRRYRLDEPEFPHRTTLDQFFTEAQFEAYRSLGEHIGEKLFMRTLIGDKESSGPISVEDWFLKLGSNLLEPINDGPAKIPIAASL